MKDEDLKLVLKALEVVKIHFSQNRHVNEAITTIKQARSAPVQEPLSTETIMQMARDVGLDLEPTRNMLVEVRGQHAQLLNLVRAVESAHRITKG
jgi:hypothetical protein